MQNSSVLTKYYKIQYLCFFFPLLPLEHLLSLVTSTDFLPILIDQILVKKSQK